MTQPRLDGVGDSSRIPVDPWPCGVPSPCAVRPGQPRRSRVGGRRGQGCRLLREQDPPGAGRAVPRVPFRIAREAQGRVAARYARGLRQGGSSGPRSCPGIPGASPLFQAITAADGVEPMPPKEKLPASVVADFRQWIKMGAPDPRDGTAQTATASPGSQPPTRAATGGRCGRSHAPASRPSPPAMAGWCRTPIDRFILARLAEKGLQPSHRGRPAHPDPPALVRSARPAARPPRRSTRSSTDRSPDAYERLVDRLLASPHYGERWARHWMDLVHFAETHGHDQDRIRPNAWPYRDYLIALVQPRHALCPVRPGAGRGRRALSRRAGAGGRAGDARGRAVGRELAPRYSRRQHRPPDRLLHRPRRHGHDGDVDICQRRPSTAPAATTTSSTRSRRRTITACRRSSPGSTRPSAATTPTRRSHRLRRAARAEIKATERRDPDAGGMAQGRAGGAAAAELWCSPRRASSRPTPATSRRAARGRCTCCSAATSISPASRPRPGTLSCVAGLPARFRHRARRRRVGPPRGPGSLDHRPAESAHLAVDRQPRLALSLRPRAGRHAQRFRPDGGLPVASRAARLAGRDASCDSGGSLKQLHRLIVTSAVYRQSAATTRRSPPMDADDQLALAAEPPAARRRDRSTTRSSRSPAGSTRRWAARRSSSSRCGPACTSRRWSTTRQYDWDSPGSRRRSVYRFMFRTLPDPFFDALDSADASQLTAVRNESTTPLQALELLNNPFVLRQCERVRPAGWNVCARPRRRRSRRAFELAYGRAAGRR